MERREVWRLIDSCISSGA